MRYLLLLLLTGFGFSLLANRYEFTISDQPGTTCFIGYYKGNATLYFDTLELNSSGNVVWEPKKEIHFGQYLFIFSDFSHVDFIIYETSFSLSFTKENPYDNVKVKGSDNNKALFTYQKDIWPIEKDLEKLNLEEKRTQGETEKMLLKEQIEMDYSKLQRINSQYANKYKSLFFGRMLALNLPIVIPDHLASDAARRLYLRRHFFEHIRLADPDLIYTKLFHEKVKFYVNNLLADDIDSITDGLIQVINRTKEAPETYQFLITYYMKIFENGHKIGDDEIFVNLVKYYYEKLKVGFVSDAERERKVSYARSIEKILIGKIAPEMNLKDTARKPISLHALPGKYKLIILWDPECSHCQKEVPQYLQLYHQYQVHGLTVFAVYTETFEKPWKRFIKENNLDWYNAADLDFSQPFREDYFIRATPAVFLLDENNRIMSKQFSPKYLEKIMNDLIFPR